MRTHDAWQIDGHRPGIRLGRRAPAVGSRAGLGEGHHPRAFENAEAAQLLGLLYGEPVPHRRAGTLAGKVAEVIDRLALVEQIAGVVQGSQPAVHRIGIHHQIVVGTIEEHPVGKHHPELFEHPAAFDVAGDHRHRQALPAWRARQQRAERRVGEHRLDARDQARIDALVGDLQHHPPEHRHHRTARRPGHRADHAAGEREQPGQEDVEVVGQQRGATSRRGDPHIALDLQLLAVEQLAQFAQLGLLFGDDLLAQAFLLLGFFLVGRRLASIGGDRFIAQRADAHQVPHQAAARMTHQRDPRPDRQRPQQLQRIVDRAFGKGAMLEAEHPLAEAPRDRTPVGFGTGRPQVLEAPHGVRAGTVDEHQHRPGRGGLLEPRVARHAAIGGRQRVATPQVETGFSRQLRFDRPHQRLGAKPRGIRSDQRRGLFAEPVLHPFARLVGGEIGDRVAVQPQHRDSRPHPVEGPT